MEEQPKQLMTLSPSVIHKLISNPANTLINCVIRCMQKETAVLTASHICSYKVTVLTLSMLVI